MFNLKKNPPIMESLKYPKSPYKNLRLTYEKIKLDNQLNRQINPKNRSRPRYNHNRDLGNLSSSKKYMNTTTVSSHKNLSQAENKSREFAKIINEKNEVINNLQIKLNELLIKTNENNHKMSIQEEIIKSLKEQIKQLNSELIRKNNIIGQNENIDNKFQKLKEDIQSTKLRNSNEELNYLKKNNFLLNEEISKINKRNENLFKKFTENKNELISKNNMIKKLNEENMKIQKNFEQLEKNFYDLSNKLNSKAPNLDNNNNNNSNNLEDNNLSNLINKNKDDYKFLEIKYKKIQDELNQAKNNIELLNNEKNLLNTKLNQKNELIKKLQKDYEINMNNLNNSNGRNIELNRLLNQKNNDLITYQKSYIEKDNKIESLLNLLKMANERIQIMKNNTNEQKAENENNANSEIIPYIK